MTKKDYQELVTLIVNYGDTRVALNRSSENNPLRDEVLTALDNTEKEIEKFLKQFIEEKSDANSET